MTRHASLGSWVRETESAVAFYSSNDLSEMSSSQRSIAHNRVVANVVRASALEQIDDDINEVMNSGSQSIERSVV